MKKFTQEDLQAFEEKEKRKHYLNGSLYIKIEHVADEELMEYLNY